MVVLAVLLVIIGVAGFGVAVVMLIARAVFKKGWEFKKTGITAGIALALFVAGTVTGIVATESSDKQELTAGRQAAVEQVDKNGDIKVSKEKAPTPQAPQAVPVPEDRPAVSKESPSDQLVKINLERKSAQNAKELAKIIEEVIKETGNVKECYVVGAEEEVSTGGYWLSAEVKLKDAKNAWQVARNGVLAAYLNKGSVQLVKVSVNIMAPPEDKTYALQVSAGKNHFNDETLRFLKNGTWVDFEAWIEENQTKGGYKQYSDDLWARGPLAF